MKQAVYTHLNADTELMALLAGGLYTVPEISRRATPAAFDSNSEVKPCGLIKIGSTIPVNPYVVGSQITIDIYLYHPSGFTVLSAALDRIYQILHRKTLTISNGTCLGIQHEADTPELYDSALDVPVRRSRYIAAVLREHDGD